VEAGDEQASGSDGGHGGSMRGTVGKLQRGGLSDEQTTVTSKPRTAMAGAAAPCEAAWESSDAVWRGEGEGEHARAEEDMDRRENMDGSGVS
jgi:hypothetical protein